MKRETIFSPCRQYRYSLWREWDMMNASYVMFIGLNPSTADETKDDPTIRRCIDYSKRWGYGALCMSNLFAWRETDPAVMKTQPHPIGADNDRHLIELAEEAAVIVAAWGTDGEHLQRGSYVKRLLPGQLQCLKLTKEGHPSHPLYLSKSLVPRPFP